jgi:hypothetical protein
MEYLIEGSNRWSLISPRGKIVDAAVGTKEELDISGRPGPYQWSVVLIGGRRHPLWGENWGSAASLEDAKRKAERFLRRL